MWPLPCYPSKNGLEIHARSEKKNQIDHVQVGVKLQLNHLYGDYVASQPKKSSFDYRIQYIEVVVM